jgi:hypothetical protein
LKTLLQIEMCAHDRALDRDAITAAGMFVFSFCDLGWEEQSCTQAVIVAAGGSRCWLA